MKKNQKFASYIELAIKLDRDNGTVPEFLDNICSSMLINQLREKATLNIFEFIGELLKSHLKRDDFYSIYSDNGIKRWVETDSFKYYYITIYSIIYAINATEKGKTEEEISDGVKKIEEMISPKKMTELTKEDFESLTGLIKEEYMPNQMVIDILPLLFTLQSQGTKDFLNGIFKRYHENHTGPSVAYQIVDTSIPQERKAGVNAEDLLNIYAKYATIDENLALTIAKEVLYNPPTTFNSACALLDMVVSKGYPKNSIDNILAKTEQGEELILCEETQRLQLAFFDGLPKKVQEQILKNPFFRRKYVKNGN